MPFLNTDLRNGIGHHAARYDAERDLVVCVKAKGADLKHSVIPYTEFCRKVLSLVSRLAIVEDYLYHAVKFAGGKLKKDD